jgi:hypothetical protein
VSRALIVVATDEDRQKAARWVAKAPWNTRVPAAADLAGDHGAPDGRSRSPASNSYRAATEGR